VELALNFFPRIVGIRDGRVKFDASPDAITPSLLEELYAGDQDGERQLERSSDGYNPFGRACRPLFRADA
jgi:ABC-type phosphate/phosphonate transport system ATPase subunit